MDRRKQKDVVAFASWRTPRVALALSCLMALGAHYGKHSLSALAPEMLSKMDLDRSQFGLMFSFQELPGIIFPLCAGALVSLISLPTAALLLTTLVSLFEDRKTQLDAVTVVYNDDTDPLRTLLHVICSPLRSSRDSPLSQSQPLSTVTGFSSSAGWYSASVMVRSSYSREPSLEFTSHATARNPTLCCHPKVSMNTQTNSTMGSRKPHAWKKFAAVPPSKKCTHRHWFPCVPPSCPTWVTPFLYPAVA